MQINENANAQRFRQVDEPKGSQTQNCRSIWSACLYEEHLIGYICVCETWSSLLIAPLSLGRKGMHLFISYLRLPSQRHPGIIVSETPPFSKWYTDLPEKKNKQSTTIYTSVHHLQLCTSETSSWNILLSWNELSWSKDRRGTYFTIKKNMIEKI